MLTGVADRSRLHKANHLPGLQKLPVPIKNDSFLQSLRTFFNLKSDRSERKRMQILTTPQSNKSPLFSPLTQVERPDIVKAISRPSEFQHLSHAKDITEAFALLTNEASSNESLISGELHSGENNASGTVVLRPHLPIETDVTLASHFQPSLETIEKAASAKIYFETYFNNLLKKPSARSDRIADLQALLTSCKDTEERAIVKKEWNRLETEHLRQLRSRIGISSFKKLKVIGHGAFGVVRLVEEKNTGQLYAMKCLKKSDMLRKGQEGHVRAERDVLAMASNSTQYIAKLEYSFQDSDHLYLVMEYLPGGDLLQLLIDQDTFEEDFAKFYTAEMINAIEEAHKLGYIHRDIKPDNFLFNAQGHICLSDFGLSTNLDWEHDAKYYEQQRTELLRRTGIDIIEGDTIDRRKGQSLAQLYRSQEASPTTHQMTWRNNRRRELAYSLVGTNSYMAPEVICGDGYGFSCDWWSLGVILFEMLFGYPPFVAKSRQATRVKIMNYQHHLIFPARPRVSIEVKSLIRNLICDRRERLGCPAGPARKSRQSRSFPADLMQKECVDDIKHHPWFRNMNFDTLHDQAPPFQPNLSDPADTKYFEEISGDEVLRKGLGVEVERARDILLRDKVHGQALLDIRKDMAFKGYTYRNKKIVNGPRFSRLNDDLENATLSSIGTSDGADLGRAMSF